MIQVHDTLSSRMLGRPLSYILLLPGEGHTARRLLTLLHGAEEGPEILLENSGLADTLPPDLAVLLPAMGNSFYLDWGSGRNARSALLRELLPAVRQRFSLSDAREDNVLGGISMGGFGAVSLALCEPGCFSAAFSLSGALDLMRAAQLFRICQLPAPGDLRQAAARPEAQLVPRLEEFAGKGTKRPALYLAWGDRDWFREENRRFSGQAERLGFPIRAEESPGLHDWTFWKRQLPPALRWASEQ